MASAGTCGQTLRRWRQPHLPDQIASSARTWSLFWTPSAGSSPPARPPSPRAAMSRRPDPCDARGLHESEAPPLGVGTSAQMSNVQQVASH